MRGPGRGPTPLAEGPLRDRLAQGEQGSPSRQAMSPRRAFAPSTGTRAGSGGRLERARRTGRVTRKHDPPGEGSGQRGCRGPRRIETVLGQSWSGSARDSLPMEPASAAPASRPGWQCPWPRLRFALPGRPRRRQPEQAVNRRCRPPSRPSAESAAWAESRERIADSGRPRLGGLGPQALVGIRGPGPQARSRSGPVATRRGDSARQKSLTRPFRSQSP